MASKKTFVQDLETPAELFISKPEKPAGTASVTQSVPEPKAPKATAPEGYKVNPLYIETRSKRLQLLLQPSILDKLKAKAQREGRSVNDIVHSILEEVLKGE